MWFSIDPIHDINSNHMSWSAIDDNYLIKLTVEKIGYHIHVSIVEKIFNFHYYILYCVGILFRHVSYSMIDEKPTYTWSVS